MKITISKLGLASLLAISIAAPCLYADCVYYTDCGSPPDPLNIYYCSGSYPMEDRSTEAAQNLYAGPMGSDACGTGHLVATGADVGGACGMTEITGECS
jgi:hypothetical protein